MENIDYKYFLHPRGLNPFSFQLSTFFPAHASTQVNPSDLH